MASGRFPHDFLWGVATAAYQVEGGIENNDWHWFTTSPAIRQRVARLSARVGRPFALAPPGPAAQHRELPVLRADLDRARALGLNAYRFSLEWSRLQPAPPRDPRRPLTDRDVDLAALRYYRQALAAIRSRGLRPIVTLNHLTLPQWVLRPPARAHPLLAVFGWPLAIEDGAFRRSLRGWENPATVEAFARFVEYVAGQLQGYVDDWITLNEPVGSLIGVGYLAGVWPPGFTLDGRRAKRAYFNLLQAHVRAYEAIKAQDRRGTARVGLAHAMLYPRVTRKHPGRTGAHLGAALGAGIGMATGAAIGARGGGWRAVVGALAGAVGGASSGAASGALWGATTRIHEAAAHQFDYFYHYHFLDSVVTGVVDTTIRRRPQDRTTVAGEQFFGVRPWRPQLDFIGLNYYRAVYVYYHPLIALRAGFSGGAFDNDLSTSAEPHHRLNDLGWEIYPEGLYFFLRSLHERYRLPILITENGLAEATDRQRAPFIVAHLQQILRAIAEGVNVIGYLHWTLVDTWEWHEGYRNEARFGLYRLDRTSSARQPTAGARALQDIIAHGDLDGAVRRYGTFSADGARVVAPQAAVVGGRG